MGGKWIPVDPGPRGYTATFVCSNCGEKVWLGTLRKSCDYIYCPWCAATMDEEEEDDV